MEGEGETRGRGEGAKGKAKQNLFLSKSLPAFWKESPSLVQKSSHMVAEKPNWSLASQRSEGAQAELQFWLVPVPCHQQGGLEVLVFVENLVNLCLSRSNLTLLSLLIHFCDAHYSKREWFPWSMVSRLLGKRSTCEQLHQPEPRLLST